MPAETESRNFLAWLQRDPRWSEEKINRSCEINRADDARVNYGRNGGKLGSVGRSLDPRRRQIASGMEEVGTEKSGRNTLSTC